MGGDERCVDKGDIRADFRASGKNRNKAESGQKRAKPTEMGNGKFYADLSMIIAGSAVQEIRGSE